MSYPRRATIVLDMQLLVDIEDRDEERIVTGMRVSVLPQDVPLPEEIRDQILEDEDFQLRVDMAEVDCD